MKCGHCKGEHTLVAEVRACANVSVEASQEELQPVGALWGWNDNRQMRPVKPSEERREERRGTLIEQVNRIGLTVPVGRYALRNEGGSANDIQFIHVERPTKGQYAGKTFVKRQLGPNLDRIPMAQQLTLLTRIATDIQGAMRLYGLELGICGNCGLPLTNEVSREYGIGPICRKNMGF